MSARIPNKSQKVITPLLALAIFGLVATAWRVMQRTVPEPLDAKRVAERTRISAEVAAQDQKALETYAWLDRDRGTVRMPIAKAMELSVTLFKEPAAGRSNLLARLEQATARLPQKTNELR